MYQKLKANGIKIFVKFLLSYMLILVIPLSLASLAYREAVNTIEKNVIRYNLSVLEQSRDIIEQRLNEIENLVLQFGLS